MLKNATFYSVILFLLAAGSALLFPMTSGALNVWQVVNMPVVIILCLLSIVFIPVIYTFTTSKRKIEIKIRAGIIFLNILLLIYVFLLFIVDSFYTEYPIYETTTSPNGEHTIQFYQVYLDSPSVYGKLEGPLWFTKIVYLENYRNSIDIEWLTDDTVKINNQTITL